MTTTDWAPIFATEQAKPYWADLMDFVQSERDQANVFPAPDEVYRAFELTPLSDVRVVILGQDPYHGAGQAHGLSFSVRQPTPPPPSLRNIVTELQDDLGLDVPAGFGSLEAWAKQGVLLLNSCLTVREGVAGSHRRQGWERFTDAIISKINALDRRIVFVLWGKPAQAKQGQIDQERHFVITAPHPSPLSAYRGFLGSRPFSAINNALLEAGDDVIDWRLVSAVN